MTIPTVNDLHAVDPVLTNMLVAYYQSEERFVAMRAFPAVPSDKSGTYYVFDKKYWFTDEMKERAAGEQYARVGFGTSTATYSTLQWALAHSIADEARAASQVPLDLETAAVRFLGLKSLIRKERAWAADFMTTSVWATDGSISNKWSDYTNGDPVADITTGKRTISQSTGKYPNLLIMGEIVRDRLINHPDLLDRIKYTQTATGGNVETALSAIFGVNVLVGAAIYNTANEGQTASLSPIIDDDALLLYATPSPSVFEASGGYTFAWAGGGGTGSIMMNRDDLNDTDLVKIKEQWDQKAVATDLGYFMADCVD